jgi:carbon-monoxide dehydrogenase medium subunit
MDTDMKNIREYFIPTTNQEAIRLLREHPGRGTFIAGGTNLVVDKDPGLDYLIDLHQLGLDYIREDEEYIRIGACTTIETLYRSPLVQSLAQGLFGQIASWFASTQIRNVATIGGNVAEGASAADTIPALLAMDAQIVLRGENERTLPIVEFLKPDGGTVLQDELIEEFLLPKHYKAASGKFLKNCKTREDISIVSVTTTVLMDSERCRQARIALGAVAPIPIRLPEAEALLEGQIPTQKLIDDTAEMVLQQIHPIDNFRAGADFRKEISRVYTKRALEECLGV